MNPLLIFYIVCGIILIAGIVLFIFALIFGKSSLDEQKIETLPYLKKKYLLTLSERKLFSLLSEVFGQQYYIFPQVHIASILQVKNGEKNWKTYFNKIIRKSVDFVIFDREDISPLLAIELDDSTHEREDRMIRDGFVDKAFKAANVSILHIKTTELDTPEQIKSNIAQLLK